MDKYKVVKLEKQLFDYLVIANTYENPINDLIFNLYVPFIENGNIIFDLTMVNGISSNRYASVEVKNNKILTKSIKTYSSIDNDIFNISRKYFMINPHIVTNSPLPSTEKYKILN